MNEKEELQTRFSRIYKGCSLYAIHLDGFSHTVFYKDENGDKHIDGYTGCAHEQYTPTNKVGSTYRSWNEDKTKVLFLGYPNYAFQGNAQELMYRPVAEW